MPCYHPLQAYLPAGGSARKKVIFDSNDPDCGLPLNLPCGQCIGCRLEYSRQWAIRMVHESKLYEKNCFITLTYDSANLPFDGSLVKKHFVDFMKRFRKRFVPRCPYPVGHDLRKQWLQDNRIRFYMCGEYGDKRGRPHYHACIFNFDFPDKRYHSTRKGVKLFTSDILSELWTYGFSSVGTVTFESAAYVARYATKKVTGKDKDFYYRDIGYVDPDTGEVFPKVSEYATMSRDGGIGREYFKRNVSDIFPIDNVVIRDSVPCRPPKYYGSIYEQDNLEKMEIIKQRRVDNADKLRYDNSRERLAVREKVLRSRLSIFGSRELE